MSAVVGILGIVMAVALLGGMTFILLYLIDMSVESVPSELSYCDDVYDRPEDFRPEDGTLEEKYDWCVNFVEVTGPQLKTNMENMRWFVLGIPIIIIVYAVLTFIVGTKPSKGDAHDRKEYDPNFKGYGKDNKPRFDV